MQTFNFNVKEFISNLGEQCRNFSTYFICFKSLGLPLKYAWVIVYLQCEMLSDEFCSIWQNMSRYKTIHSRMHPAASVSSHIIKYKGTGSIDSYKSPWHKMRQYAQDHEQFLPFFILFILVEVDLCVTCPQNVVP